jgi:hypothetical protein
MDNVRFNMSAYSNDKSWVSDLTILTFIYSIPTPGTDGRFNSTAEYALGTRSVSADLKMVPNQALQCQVSLLQAAR